MHTVSPRDGVHLNLLQAEDLHSSSLNIEETGDSVASLSIRGISFALEDLELAPQWRLNAVQERAQLQSLGTVACLRIECLILNQIGVCAGICGGSTGFGHCRSGGLLLLLGLWPV